MKKTFIDQRYPYTHACDFIRMLGPIGKGGVILSRSDASQIRTGIADALGISDKIVANKLADAQLNKTDGDLKKETDRILKAIS